VPPCCQLVAVVNNLSYLRGKMSIQEQIGQPSRNYDADRTPYKRREDFRLTTGQGAYVDDYREIDGRPVLHLMVVRSPHAHAVIKNINLEAVRAMPGVVAAFSGADMAKEFNPMPTFPLPGLKVPVRYPLAVDRVRYVGDPVAAILAENRTAAEDAVAALSEQIEYEPLPAVTDPEAALEKDAPVLYEDLGSNVAFVNDMDSGDVDGVFAKADRIVRLRVVNQRLAPSPLEPRAALFDYNPQTGEYNAWLSTQAVFRARDTLARLLKLDPAKIRARVADMGGGFGSKTGWNGEELVAAWAAKHFGQPVKWMESRSENLMCNTHGRGQINYIEAAVTNEGRLLGLRVNTIADLGAWLALVTPMVPTGTPRMLNGVYRQEAISSRVVGVLSNKVPTSAYRGAGRPEAAYILERTMDKIAAELNLDPVEVRLKNFIPPEAFPYQALTGVVYDSGNYATALQKAAELADLPKWRAEQRKRREEGSSKPIGIGLSVYLEIAGGGGAAGPGIPQEAATVLVRSDGKVVVQSGVAHNGQGHFTAFAQIVGGVLGVPVDEVEVMMGDTALPAYGIGTFGSRTTAVSGSAIFLAAEGVRSRLLQGAARLLEAAEADLELASGQIAVKGSPGHTVTFAEVAAAEEGGVISEWRDFSPSGATFPSGAHIAVVEVDTETGEPHILQYVAVDDCGRVLNELLADGQVHGSLAQGLSQALYEEIVYDEDGQLLSGTLMDYTMPTALQLPNFTAAFVETPSPTNPLGAKGVGESGCTGGPPAIVNAVLDALRPLGVQALDMPLKAEKLWQTVNAARAGVSAPERQPNQSVFARQPAKATGTDEKYTFE
jgi:carbon-monoxide dehydrogenase large subunit